MTDIVFEPETTVIIQEGTTSVTIINSESQVNTISAENEQAAQIVSTSEPSVLQSTDSEVHVIESAAVGPQGPQGVQGIPGPDGTVYVQYVAGETLSGHRVVYLGVDQKVYYASNTSLQQVLSVVGITTGACIEGDDAVIKTHSEMEEPSWNWEADKPIFLGLNGMLTQEIPTSGISFRVGQVLSPTLMFVNFSEPIILS